MSLDHAILGFLDVAAPDRLRLEDAPLRPRRPRTSGPPIRRRSTARWSVWSDPGWSRRASSRSPAGRTARSSPSRLPGAARCASGSRPPPALAAARPAAAAAVLRRLRSATTRSSRCWTPHATASSDASRRCARTTFPGTRPARGGGAQDDPQRRDGPGARRDGLDRRLQGADRCRLAGERDARSGSTG